MSKARFQAVVLLVAVAAAFGVGVYTGVNNRAIYAAAPVSAIAPEGVDLAPFWKTWWALEERYVQTHASSTIPSKDERMWSAIQGLVDSYGDPYTVFMPPREAEAFAEEISGSFEGVGMEVGAREGSLVVVAPLKDTPAERAGVLPGDRILLIDDTPAERLPVDDAIALIRGPRGTEVVLTIARDGTEEPLRIPITRGVIELPTINYHLRSDGIFIVELYNFSAISADKFREALRAFVNSRSKKLVLDLRGNPGGYLEAAVDMASFFLPVGAPIVTEDFDGKQENIVHRSRGYNVFANNPIEMVILVNQGSASASEILAGALSERDVAVLVGGQTFGKGSVQQLVDVGGGGELKLTVARWLTPNGISISDGGLTPKVMVDMTAEDVKAGRDPQLEEAVRLLSGYPLSGN